MQRSINEMFREKDDKKPKRLTNGEDKNYDDLESPELQFASGELTEIEMKGMPTEQSLPNYETDYKNKTPINVGYNQNGSVLPTGGSNSKLGISL